MDRAGFITRLNDKYGGQQPLMGMSQSRLSVLSCFDLGRAYLETLSNLTPEAHADYRINADPTPSGPVQDQAPEPPPPQSSFSPVRKTLRPAEKVLAELGFVPEKRKE